MDEMKASFVNSSEDTKMKKSIKNLHEYFQVNHIHTSDAVSTMANLIVGIFIQNYGKREFKEFMSYLERLYDLNPSNE